MSDTVVDGSIDATKAIFGSDSESDDDQDKAPSPPPPPAATGVTSNPPSSKSEMVSIFGGDSDSDDDVDANKMDETPPDNIDATARVKSEGNTMDFMFDGDNADAKESKQVVSHSKLCIPKTLKLEEDAMTFSVKLPNFLKLQTKPYNKQLHHEETEAAQYAGATSMIRCRYKQNQNGDVELDEKGLPIRESNTRLVKWTDGSYQLIVGQEVFDSTSFPVTDSYLYTQRKSAAPLPSDPAYEDTSAEERAEFKTDTCLECVGAAAGRIVLRPSSVVSAAHARLSLAIAEKYSRKTKIKDREYGSVIINAEKDTDARAAAINEELRRAERRRRAEMDSQSAPRYQSAPSMSSRYIEEDERRYSSSSLKHRQKNRQALHSSDEEEEDEEPDEEDNDFIVNDDEEEEDGDWGDRSDESGDDDDDDSEQKKKDKRGKVSKKSIAKDNSESESEQEDFDTVKPKKRLPGADEDADEKAKDGNTQTQKKRRRIVSSDEED